ncbi:MAG: chemotaxis protein CheX [Acidobacteria bacterium]|nr:chemotaxis protein CheX [Acidobacteriota bacterium]
MNSSAMARHSRNTILPQGDCAPMLETATREVFEIMLGAQVNSPSESEPPPVADLTAMVGLAGRICGVLSLRCEATSACRMAAKMLGVEAVETAEFGDDARDAIGEICNMVAGNFKAKLAGLVEGCVLSVPTVITGADYQLHMLADGTRTEISFGFEGSPVWITLDLHN